MKNLDKDLYLVISDLFINISAGWFGAAFIVPAFSKEDFTLNIGILTTNLLMGILFLVLAYKLRKQGGVFK